MDLAGKVAIVTGAGGGLGRAYAESLAGAGVAVIVNDTVAGRVAEVVDHITNNGGRAAGVVAAVGPSAAADELVAGAIREFGRLDVVVSNAGILRDGVLWKMSDEDFDAVIDVHLRGTFTLGRAAARHMRDQGEGGRLVLVGSPAGQRGSFGQTNYAAAKAGIVAMARTWALELARAEITVNAIVPVAATDMVRTIPALAPVFEEYDRTGGPLPAWLRKDEGLGLVEDVAPLVNFLASDASAGVTGQALGLGGDRFTLWSHPSEKVVRVAENGWTTELIEELWTSELAGQAETYGIPAPRIPDAGPQPKE